MNTAQNYQITLDLHTNHVYAITRSGQSITDRQEATDLITRLLRSDHGAFQFVNTERHTGTLLIPLYPLIQSAAQEQTVSDADLPHPDTRFQLTAAPQDIPDGLRGRGQDLLPLLRLGTTASEAASLLGWSLHDCQVLLHRYRAAGLTVLSPLLADRPSAATTQTADTRTTLRRFLSRLRNWRPA